jgi:hypothetical protein
MTGPRGSLYVALCLIAVAIVTLTPVVILVAVALWVIGTWGVRYDERHAGKRTR